MGSSFRVMAIIKLKTKNSNFKFAFISKCVFLHADFNKVNIICGRLILSTLWPIFEHSDPYPSGKFNEETWYSEPYMLRQISSLMLETKLNIAMKVFQNDRNKEMIRNIG